MLRNKDYPCDLIAWIARRRDAGAVGSSSAEAPQVGGTPAVERLEGLRTLLTRQVTVCVAGTWDPEKAGGFCWKSPILHLDPVTMTVTRWDPGSDGGVVRSPGATVPAPQYDVSGALRSGEQVGLVAVDTREALKQILEQLESGCFSDAHVYISVESIAAGEFKHAIGKRNILRMARSFPLAILYGAGEDLAFKTSGLMTIIARLNRQPHSDAIYLMR